MRVAFSALTLIPGLFGGTETYARETFRALAAAPEDLEMTVIANDRSASVYAPIAEGTAAQVRVADGYRTSETIPGRFAAMGRAWLRPSAFAAQVGSKYDVIHYPFTVPLPKLQGAARVVSLHDLQHVVLPEFFSPQERTWRRIAYGRAAERADSVITISHASKDDIARFHGIDPGKIWVAYLGIDHQRFTPTPRADEDQRRKQLGLPERFIFYPANFWPHKNHEVLFKALAQVSDIELVLTGATYGREAELLALAHACGVESRVTHLGFVDHDDMPVLLRAAAALVFPSLFEGFGAPPIEAMACGTPVAVSDRGSLPEVCGPEAVAFDPSSFEATAEAIETVLQVNDERLPARVEWARKFTWEGSADQHRKAYRAAFAARA